MAPPYTTSGAVIALLATLGTGLTFYRDRPKEAAAGQLPRPYGIVTERQGMGAGRLEDGGPGTAIESVHIDIWQDWKSADGKTLAEDASIVAKIERGVHGGSPPGGSRVLGSVPGGAGVIYRTKLTSSHRLEDANENTIHNALVIAVWRQF